MFLTSANIREAKLGDPLPVFNKGSKEHLGNYRVFDLTHVLNKLVVIIIDKMIKCIKESVSVEYQYQYKKAYFINLQMFRKGVIHFCLGIFVKEECMWNMYGMKDVQIEKYFFLY